MTEYANDSVTAKGNPSGIDTTIILIAKIKYFNIYEIKFLLHPWGMRSLIISLIVRVKNTIAAVAIPNLPILLTKWSNLIYKGVCY